MSRCKNIQNESDSMKKKQEAELTQSQARANFISSLQYQSQQKIEECNSAQRPLRTKFKKGIAQFRSNLTQTSQKLQNFTNNAFDEIKKSTEKIRQNIFKQD